MKAEDDLFCYATEKCANYMHTQTHYHVYKLVLTGIIHRVSEKS